jgi:hypothetical protein
LQRPSKLIYANAAISRVPTGSPSARGADGVVKSRPLFVYCKHLTKSSAAVRMRAAIDLSGFDLK